MAVRAGENPDIWYNRQEQARSCVHPTKDPQKEAMDSEPALSDYFAKLATSPDSFPFFYRRLISLHFPIEVAEILELRYLTHHAIDRAEMYGEGLEFRQFAADRGLDMDKVGIGKTLHRERLAQLLLLIRDYHKSHAARSNTAEARIRAALAENQFAQARSKHYSKNAGVAALFMAASSLLLSPPAVLMQGLTIFLCYLSADYLYSLSLLRREQRALQSELGEILRRRVRAINWRAIIRQTATILGYAQPLGGEAFRVEHEVDYNRTFETNDA